MVNQVKEELRQQGRLQEFAQTVFKIVCVEDRYDNRLPEGKFRPYVVGSAEGPAGKVIYTQDKLYKVGINFSYPPFAYLNEMHAREIINTGGKLDAWAIVSCVAYQWAFVQRYLALDISFPDLVGRFWGSMIPFKVSDNDTIVHNGMYTYRLDLSSIVMYEFEIGDVIYG